MKQPIFATTSLYVQLTAVALLANYVRLVPGVPTRLHFTDQYFVDREIADRETGNVKKIRSLVFWVDSLEGEDVARTFSILSQKLAAHFEPFLENGRYKEYDFILTEVGEGFQKDWVFQALRRPEEG